MERHTDHLPGASVVVCECWARDGLQSMPVVVPTSQKIEMIDRITAAGFKKVEVTSFSHPKLLPQCADAVEVLRGIRRRQGVSHVVPTNVASTAFRPASREVSVRRRSSS